VTAKIRVHFREPTVDTNRPIADGTVPIEGFELQLVDRQNDADAWDCSFAMRMLNFVGEPRSVSIPAFPNRKFRLSYIYVNEKSGIALPRDLAGKRIGIRQWANTAGVWARGALHHHYGVDLTGVQWVAARADATKLPASLRIEFLDGARGAPPDLDALLVAGAIDALIDADVPPSITRRDGRTRRLFRNYKAEEQDYFRKTGIFPISHLITLQESFVDRHPDAPVALLTAFRRARDIAIDNIQGSDPQVLVLLWASQALDEQRALMGDDFFAYDIAHNRTALDAMMQFAHEQFLTQAPLDYRRLFSPAAMALAGV
jgi:4,5-dihydroxyphthalate decarboxylase